MSAALTRQRPAGTGRGCRNSIEYGKPTTSSRLPHDWRHRLPSPATYYSTLDGLGRPNGSGWASVRCPFHEDRTASLSINLQHGGWRCHAGCGSGDWLGFHMKLSGKAFAEAVRDLLGARP